MFPLVTCSDQNQDDDDEDDEKLVARPQNLRNARMNLGL